MHTLMRPERHCESPMRVHHVPLLNGRMRVDQRCIVCGHQERSVYSASMKLLSWQNISLQRTLREIPATT